MSHSKSLTHSPRQPSAHQLASDRPSSQSRSNSYAPSEENQSDAHLEHTRSNRENESGSKERAVKKKVSSKKPLVSVCVITFNQEEYIGQCLESILTQKTDFDFEVLINDDCSTDKTLSILKDFKAKYPKQVKLVLQKENQFSQGLRNFIPRFLLPKSSGTYFAICEGDDYWIDEYKLQKQVDLLEGNKDLALCFGVTKVVFENNEQESSLWPTNITKESLTVLSLVTENFIPTNTVMYRKQNYDAYSFDPVPGDWYLHLYHAQFGGIGYLDDVLSVYRRHDAGLWWNTYKDPAKHLEENGPRMLVLLGEVMKIYSKDPAVRNQIYRTATDLITKIVSAGNNVESPRVRSAFGDHGEFLAESIHYLNKTVQDQKSTIQTDEKKIDALEKEARNIRYLNKGLTEKAAYLQSEIEGLNDSPLVGKTIKAARLKARVVEDIRLNKGAAIRRKIYRKTMEKPYRKARDAYVQKRLKYDLIENTKAKKDAPLVSVVIPYYNRHETVMETLDSLLKQTYTNFEVILVDDGSTKKASKDMLKTIAKHPLKPHIIEQENMGVAMARNNGINATKGRYVMCLDPDDMIKPLYIEKCLAVLESDPDVSLVTTGIEAFGVSQWHHIHQLYDPLQLFAVNMAGTASLYRKEAWEDAGGYKDDLGYEDWDLWLSMAEKGHFGRRIPELLFLYRTANESRFIEDRSAHAENIKKIQSLHPEYRKNVRAFQRARRYLKRVVAPHTAFVNLDIPKDYRDAKTDKPRAIVFQPWMTFGGAETVTLNFTRELTRTHAITFMTGLDSEHEWEHRFAEISNHIYHLPNLFDSPAVYLEFISNYIQTHNVEILHLVHTNFAHSMIAELKKRNPKLRVILTMFNARVDHFPTIKECHESIDMLTSDNSPVVREYEKLGVEKKKTRVIPNGIDASTTFNPENYDRRTSRTELGLDEGDIAVFFIGRLSSEKNPDVFIDAAQHFAAKKEYRKLKFFVVGDGVMESVIKKAAERAGNVRYLGYRSDIAQLLRASDVFVLPSSIEGFPLSILEAMAMNNVCVASDVGAIPDIIRDGVNGVVVEPGSVNGIIDSLYFLADNPKKLDDMTKKSREAVTTLYSSEILGKNYRKLYKDARS